MADNTGNLGRGASYNTGTSTYTAGGTIPAPVPKAAPSDRNPYGTVVTDGSGRRYYFDGKSYYEAETGRAVDGTKFNELHGPAGGVAPPVVTTPPPTANVLPSQNRYGAQGADPFQAGSGGTPVAPARTAPAGRQLNQPVTAQTTYGVDPSRVPNPTAPAGQPTNATSGLGDLLSAYGMQLPDFNPNFDKYLKPAEDVFRGELERLSQADPFGNQAFLQKATDRGVSQARAVAAGARGGAGAVGGAFRQAQGIQSQVAAQGAQEMTELKAQDAQRAQALRLQAAQGLGGLAQAGAGLAVESEKGKIGAFTAGIDAILRSEQLSQQDRQFYESLNLQWSSLDEQAQKRITDAAVAYSQIDNQRYATDVGYRQAVDNNIVQRYGVDKNFEAKMKEIAEKGKLTFKDVFLGTLSAGGAGVAALAGKPG